MKNMNKLPGMAEYKEAILYSASVKDEERWLRSMKAAEARERAEGWFVSEEEDRYRKRQISDQEEWVKTLRREELEAQERRRRANEAYRARMATKPKACVLFPSPRHRLLWCLWQRQQGNTIRGIAAMLGVSPAVVGQLCQKAERQIRGSRPKLHLRAYLSRPVDMGGPRDVWMQFYPPPDPRLDNMVPVQA